MHAKALDVDALLTDKEAADLLNISVRTLQAWRLRIAGPAFVQVGRAIRYRRRDLIHWIEANTISPSRTSDSSERGHSNHPDDYVDPGRLLGRNR